VFTILNRLRGTWSWMSKVNGVVLGLLVYLVFGDWFVASLVTIGYVAGESFGWGDWVGTLTTNRTTAIENTEEGKNNGIRFLTRLVFAPETEWRNYCRMALTLRGLYWWLPTLLPLVMVGVDVYMLAIAIAVLSIGFPIACELDKRYPQYLMRSKYFTVWGHWETQELYYGFLQDITFVFLFLLIT